MTERPASPRAPSWAPSWAPPWSPPWSPPWGWAVVRGDSMLPTLREGDRLLVSYRRRPARGDVVLARLADGTLAIKRAAERRTTGWWLLSDNASVGIDSRHRGAVREADVLAVALARAWPRPRPRLRRAPPVT